MEVLPTRRDAGRDVRAAKPRSDLHSNFGMPESLNRKRWSGKISLRFEKVFRPINGGSHNESESSRIVIASRRSVRRSAFLREGGPAGGTRVRGIHRVANGGRLYRPVLREFRSQPDRPGSSPRMARG